MNTRLASPARATTLFGFAACAFVVGCVDSNDRESIGTQVVLGSLSGSDTPPAEVVITGGKDDVPSITSMDRANWGEKTFLVPVDGTDHRPQYTSNLAYTDTIRRQRNQQPTVESALDLDNSPGGNAWNERFEEALFSPFWAFAEAVLILPRLVVEPQTKVEVSPSESYQRVRQVDTTPAAAAAENADTGISPAPPNSPAPYTEPAQESPK